MKKLTRNLIIGGSAATAVAGGATGAALAFNKKKENKDQVDPKLEQEKEQAAQSLKKAQELAAGVNKHGNELAAQYQIERSQHLVDDKTQSTKTALDLINQELTRKANEAANAAHDAMIAELNKEIAVANDKLNEKIAASAATTFVNPSSTDVTRQAAENRAIATSNSASAALDLIAQNLAHRVADENARHAAELAAAVNKHGNELATQYQVERAEQLAQAKVQSASAALDLIAQNLAHRVADENARHAAELAAAVNKHGNELATQYQVELQKDAEAHAAAQVAQNAKDRASAVNDFSLSNSEEGRVQSSRAEDTARTIALNTVRDAESLKLRMSADATRRAEQDALMNALAQQQEDHKITIVIDTPISSAEVGRVDTTDAAYVANRAATQAEANEAARNFAILDSSFASYEGQTDVLSTAAWNAAKEGTETLAAAARSFLDAEREVLHVNKQGNMAMTKASNDEAALEENHRAYGQQMASQFAESNNIEQTKLDQNQQNAEQRAEYDHKLAVDNFNKQLAEQRVEEQTKFNEERQVALEQELHRERSVVADDLARREQDARHLALMADLHRQEEINKNELQARAAQEFASHTNKHGNELATMDDQARQAIAFAAQTGKSGEMGMTESSVAQDADKAYQAFVAENEKQEALASAQVQSIEQNAKTQESQSISDREAAEKLQRQAHDQYLIFIAERNAFIAESERIAAQEEAAYKALAVATPEDYSQRENVLANEYTAHTADVSRMLQERAIQAEREAHQQLLNNQMTSLAQFVSKTYSAEIKLQLPQGVATNAWHTAEDHFGGIQLPAALQKFITESGIKDLGINIGERGHNHYTVFMSVMGHTAISPEGKPLYAVVQIDASPAQAPQHVYQFMSENRDFNLNIGQTYEAAHQAIEVNTMNRILGAMYDEMQARHIGRNTFNTYSSKADYIRILEPVFQKVANALHADATHRTAFEQTFSHAQGGTSSVYAQQSFINRRTDSTYSLWQFANGRNDNYKAAMTELYDRYFGSKTGFGFTSQNKFQQESGLWG